MKRIHTSSVLSILLTKEFALVMLLMLFMDVSSSGQVRTSVSPTGKHAKTIGKYKRAEKHLKGTKKKAKAIKRQIEVRQQYAVEYDSLAEVYQDSLAIELITEEDSIAIAHELLRSGYLPPDFELMLTIPVTIDSSSLNNLDSMVLATGVNELEKVAAEYIPEQTEVRALNIDAPQGRANPNAVPMEKAAELLGKINVQEFNQIQEKVSKLKNKYSALPNSQDLSTGTKRNAITDVPAIKRIGLNGMVNLKSTDPLVLAVNLQLGYWINKKWQAGVGLVCSQQLNQRDSTSNVQDSFGHNVFLRHDFYKNFFAWGEYSRQLKTSLFDKREPAEYIWENAYLIGIGSEFKLGRATLTSMVLYDLNYQSNTINKHPLVFRLGINLMKKPW